MNQKLGKAIKMARIEAGETQAVFSKNFEVAQQTITDWERTGIVPTKHWNKLKDIYGVNVMEFNNKNIKTKNQSGNNNSAEVIYSTTNVKTDTELTPQLVTLVDLINKKDNPEVKTLELIKQLLLENE
jgi:DNA-binding XRE family transcriptional regulator